MFNREVSTELIHYQVKDKFIKEAEKIVEDIYIDIGQNKYKNNKELALKSPLIRKLENLIFERFGILCSIPHELAHHRVAMVYFFLGDYNNNEKDVDNTLLIKNILDNLGGDFSLFYNKSYMSRLNNIVKEYIKQLSLNHNKKGFIDLKYAKVGGYFSTYHQFFVFNFFDFYEYKLTTTEVVAIILHEIGHVFHEYVVHNHLERINQIYLDIVTEINKNNLDKAIYIYNNKISTDKIFKRDSVNENISKEDFNRVLLANYLDLSRSQIDNAKYLETNREAIADNFATKFGLGKDIVTALSKINGISNATPDTKYVIYSVSAISQIFFLFIFMSNIVLIAMLPIILYFFYGENNKDMTYDSTYVRYKRIRNSMVRYLSEITQLDKNRTKSMLVEIEVIDKLLELTPKEFNVINTIVNNTIPKHINAKYYMDIQREIEDNLNNELYVKAAKMHVS